MNAPGKGLLKTVSILFIIFGAIATLFYVVALMGSAALSTAGFIGAVVGGTLLVSSVIMLIASVLELIIGIMGVGRSGNPDKAGFFITTGIVLCILTVIPFIITISAGAFDLTSLIGFILPVLYIIGGSMNKKAATV
jgi:hypothetical protein